MILWMIAFGLAIKVGDLIFAPKEAREYMVWSIIGYFIGVSIMLSIILVKLTT